MTIFAYLRVSTSVHDQTTDNQKKAIKDAGFAVDEWIAEDGVSGSIRALERPEFTRLMATATKGDTVICTMVDRLGRNASDILHTVDEFKRLGIRLRIMQFDGIDVTSSTGKMIITVMAAFAELEKNILVERTVSGLQRTKAEGTVLGPPLLIHPVTLRAMEQDKGAMSLDKLAHKYNFPRNTIHRNLKKWGGKMEEYEQEFNLRERQYAGVR